MKKLTENQIAKIAQYLSTYEFRNVNNLTAAQCRSIADDIALTIENAEGIPVNDKTPAQECAYEIRDLAAKFNSALRRCDTHKIKVDVALHNRDRNIIINHINQEL